MAYKNHHKKIFVVVAALFVLFAPVGMTMGNGANGSATTHAGALALSPYSTFQPSFNFNIAEASATLPVSVGQNQPNTSFNLLGCASQPVTCSIYGVSLVVNGAMGLFLMGSAYLVKLGLQFNDNIFNAPGIQIGFSVSLAIANLGFVLGIIIIAIATIIRNQTYGIKQLLWKLVFMAILVNFGLVITAPIVGFANGMSTYFVNATSPSTATGGYSAYVSTMMSAFNPQAVTEAPAAGNGSTTAQIVAGAICQHWLALGSEFAVTGFVNPATIYAICKLNGVQTSDPSTNYWQNVMALLFDIVFSAIATFTFLCLAILLIIRYLMLGGLLIVLPLAWLTYVFPKFDNSYSKWWNTFIKWTFFPPIALFFIYLAFTTATIAGSGNQSSQAASYTMAAVGGGGTDTSLVNGLVTQTGIGGGVFEQAGQEVLLVGLMIMGLMFALSLSGKAGSTVVNGATTASKAVGGYVGKKTGKGAARLYQKAGGRDLNAALQRNRIPGFSAIGRGMANLTESATKNQVDAQHKALGLGAMDDDRLQAVTQGLHGKEAQFAAVQEWQKRGKLDKIEKIGGVSFAEWLSKNQQPLKDYGQGKLSGEIDNAMMSNEEIRRIARVKATAGATAEVVDEKGIIGPAGATVRASDMVSRADEEAKKAQEIVDLRGADTFIPHNGSQVRAGDLVAFAKAASQNAKDAIDKKGDGADVVDEEGRLGAKRAKQRAGDLLDAATEKFWEGKDKSAVAKMRPDVIFGGKPKFGLDQATLTEIGRSVAHGVVTQAPGVMGSLAGKTDNLKQLTELTGSYTKSVQEAQASKKISADQAQQMGDAIKKMLGSKLAFMGGGEAEHPAAAPAAPTPPPTH